MKILDPRFNERNTSRLEGLVKIVCAVVEQVRRFPGANPNIQIRRVILMTDVVDSPDKYLRRTGWSRRWLSTHFLPQKVLRPQPSFPRTVAA